jgi:UDP-N-acetylmuramate--alanine ligase
VTLFQPHRYTRTEHQMGEFARSFYAADVVLITDIYAASEDPIPGVTAEALAASVGAYGHKHVEYAGALDAAVDRVLALARPGDLVLTLGAGNVHRAGEEILRRLEAQGG